MSPRYFTLEEANALLPKLEPLMAQLLERRAKVVRLRNQVGERMNDLRTDFGSPTASEMAQDCIVIEKLIQKIQGHGCVIKSVNAGLLDFLAKLDGRHVYLCWRYGEPEIAFYHELHKGFSGRRHL
jgi:hypothetical protein